MIGLSVRSAYWMGEKILVGTNAGEVFEVLAADKEKPKTIVQVTMEWTLKMFFILKCNVFPVSTNSLQGYVEY